MSSNLGMLLNTFQLSYLPVIRCIVTKQTKNFCKMKKEIKRESKEKLDMHCRDTHESSLS